MGLAIEEGEAEQSFASECEAEPGFAGVLFVIRQTRRVYGAVSRVKGGTNGNATDLMENADVVLSCRVVWICVECALLLIEGEF